MKIEMITARYEEERVKSVKYLSISSYILARGMRCAVSDPSRLGQTHPWTKFVHHHQPRKKAQLSNSDLQRINSPRLPNFKRIPFLQACSFPQFFKLEYMFLPHTSSQKIDDETFPMAMPYFQIPANSTKQPSPFQISIPEDKLTDFKALLKLSKITPPTYESLQEDRRFGVSHKWITEAKKYWEAIFDW
jgi:Epoxide hydrolase N terminus